MSKERPILFSAPMVRALLDGSKTQTRRIVKMKQSDWCKEIKGDCWHPNEIAEWRLQDGRWFGLMGWYTLAFADCPYGQIGDRLWVRENWAFHKMAIGSVEDKDGPFAYAADTFGQQQRLADKWTPSIHMPRWASRILLEITDIRVERLNDISEADAKAEGVYLHTDGKYTNYLSPTGYAINAKSSFASLWESINGDGSWDANPWVWVVEFKRIDPGKGIDHEKP